MKSNSTVVLTPPAAPLSGEITPPGDKSISQRLAILLPLAAGASVLRGFLNSEDALNTLRAMAALGSGVRFPGENRTEVRIEGSAGKWSTPDHPLDLGNSGTGLRLLTGLLAGTTVTAELTGDASLRSRPMGRIRDPLVQMGADIELRGEKPGCAPLRIRGCPLRGIRYPLPVASAQVKSAVLLAGLFADGRTTVVEPLPTRDHTERVFRAMGLPVQVNGNEISIEGYGRNGPPIPAGIWHVPGDFSSAAFALVAAAAGEGGGITVRNTGLNPGRTAALDVLLRMGARIRVTAGPGAGIMESGEEWEPRGDLHVEGGTLQATDIGGAEIPNLIDEIPVLAVAAALARGRTRIRDAAELRVKESDRIAAVCENLSRAGIDVEAYDDGMAITGGEAIEGGAVFESHGDHRIAMSFAVLSLFAKRPCRIRHVACVATSYPGFWSDLRKLGAGVRWE